MNLKEFISKFGLKDKLLALTIAFILALFVINNYNYNRYQEAKIEAVKKEANLAAATDKLRIVEANNKERTKEYNKLTYIVSDLSELKKLNQDLAREVSITKGQVLTIQKTTSVIHDTIRLVTEKPVIVDGVAVIKSGYDTTFSPGNFRKLIIETSFNTKDSSAKAVVTKDSIGFTAVTGLKKTDLGYEIFFRTGYPSLSLVSLEGSIISEDFFKPVKQKPKLITLGVGIGWTPALYDLRSKKLSINPNNIGVTAGFNFNLSRILNK